MQLLPYTGKQRSFTTALNIEESQQRLFEEVVDEASDAYAYADGWMPLLLDPGVVCKIDGQQFALKVRHPYLPKQPCRILEGTLEDSGTGTTITMSYHPDITNDLSVWGGYGLTLLTIG